MFRRLFCCVPCIEFFEHRALSELTVDTAERWRPPIKKAKVIDVYDGDTCTLAAFIEDRAYKFRCRLARIDAPEMRPDASLSARARDFELRAAKRSKQLLKDICLNRIVELHNVSNEKWGRVLADLRVVGDTEFVSDIMMRAGLAIPYDGGKKINYDWSRANPVVSL